MALAKQGLASRPETKVLLVCGYSEQPLRRRGAKRGNFEHLDKPFSSDALSQKVRQILDGQAAPVSR